MIETVVFYILAALLLGMGLLVITRTNPMASAVGMIGAFAALAGLYLLQSAPLLAVLQILVYAGGIMVLMIFVIMLLNLRDEDMGSLRAKGVWVTGALLGITSVVFGQVFLVIFPTGQWKNAVLPEGFGSIFSVGEKIFASYLFPFEILSLLLLTAVVGAMVLAKRRL
jgi:NADH-quinone oxidoreductase subunit J